MICSKCGQELKEGAKFCTKCGTSFKETAGLVPSNLTLPIISIILSVIGIGGIFLLITLKPEAQVAYLIFRFLPILPIAGILIALFVQNKQKSLLGFFAGLIPCIYLIIMQVLRSFLIIWWG